MVSIPVYDLAQLPPPTPTFVAIGSFDGVHRGHQAVLTKMVQAARDAGVKTAVLTFFPHPKRVIQGSTDPYYISTLSDRTALLAELGLDLVVVHPFDEVVRHTRAADFVAMMRQRLDMRQLWGGNFALGYQRQGNIPFLRQLGLEMGYTVEVVDSMMMWNNTLVSSSRIRHSLKAGDIADVNGCLKRPYRVIGEVVRGDQRGRLIGFPTANIHYWQEQLLPANGVYATYAWVDQTRYLAATNVGVRPTVDGHRLTVEAHLLNFDADLYGQTLRVDFIGRIRPEMKFSGLEALKAQIQADVEQVREIDTLIVNGEL